MTVKALVVFLAMTVTALFSVFPWSRYVDYLWYDTLFLLRGSIPPPSNIVIVAIDEPSFSIFQMQWPWPRELHARLIETLYAAGAKTIAIDILFAEPANPAGDQQLAQSLAIHPDTFLSAALDIINDPNYERVSLISPPVFLVSDKRQIGGINLPSDSDGFIRRSFLTFGPVQSLPFQAAYSFSSGKEKTRLESQRHSIQPIGINYFGPTRSIPTISYYQALEPATHLPKNFFRDKLVFIGLSLQAAPEIKMPATDHFPFPFSRQDNRYISGVEIHATAAANLLSGNFIHPSPGGILWIGIVWIIGFLVIVFPKPLRSLVMTGLLILGTAFSSILLFSIGNIHFPFTTAVLPVAAGGLVSPIPLLITLRKEKRFIRSIFSRYVSPKVVDSLLQNPKQLQLGGQMVDATVLYLDIADFTGKASRMPPEALVAMLSRYLGHFSDIIFKWEGMVDKFIGDGIMAVWGAPLPQPDHALRACRAALEILESIAELKQEKTALGDEEVSIRIGINSGQMLAGNVGGKRFLNYTVHGEATNLAVRLEAVNKVYATQILLGAATVQQLGNEFVTREIDHIQLAGQQKPVTIHQLLGPASMRDSAMIERNRLFEAAKKLYLKRRFEEAADMFSRLVKLDPADGPSHLFIDRCRRYISEPPPSTWNGIFEIWLK